MDPINYNMLSIDPLQMMALQQQGLADRKAEEAAILKQQKQAQADAEYESDLAAAFAPDADPRLLAKMALKYPVKHESIKAAFDGLQAADKKEAVDALGRTMSFIQSGRADLAKANLQQVRDAYTEAGRDTKNLDQMIAMFSGKEGAQGVYNLSAMTLANGDPESYQKLISSPAFLRKAQADAANSETTAKYAAPLAESKLATDRMSIKKQLADIENQAKLSDIELEKLGISRGELDLKRKELLMKAQEGPQLPAGLLKIQDDAQAEASRAQGMVDRVTNLQGMIAAVPSGYVDRALGSFNSSLGTDWAATRNELEAVLSEAVRNNKPGQGSISDSDMKFMQRGVPGPDASPREIGAFLESLKRIQGKIAVNQSMRALWVEQNGSLGRLKGDLQLDNGVVIPAGTSLPDAMNMNSKQLDKGKTQQQAPAQGLEYFMGRYGKG